MRLIHISPSALAGAPSMLSNALEDLGFVQSSIHFRAGDYGAERALMASDSIEIKNHALDKELFLSSYKVADIVHVHNFVPRFVLGWIAEVGLGNRKFFYQVHSPRYEKPIFSDLSEAHGLPFAKHLVVGHFHPRQFPGFKIVPNCLYRRRSVIPSPLFQASQALRVLFSPSSENRGRFSSKSSNTFENALRHLRAFGEIELIKMAGIPPSQLAAYRNNCDISIDEVITGGYHLVSYEGLAAGNVVINHADQLSLLAFRTAFQAPPPPFLNLSARELVNELLEINKDRHALEIAKKKNREFFDEWMSPPRVCKMFMDIYEN